mgnify:CR=1 FL=1
MIIKNVKIFQEDHAFHAGVIYLQDGMIEHIHRSLSWTGRSRFRQEGEQVIDGCGCYAIPGMIDLHFHGCMGSDVCDATEEALHTIAKYEASIGVTAISPATMTLSGDELVHVLENAATYKKKMAGAADAAYEAELVGINMEGPFISRRRRGTRTSGISFRATWSCFTGSSARRTDL